MTRFQKMLRSYALAAQHAFKNQDLKSRTEPYWKYQCDGMDERVKKSLHKGQRERSIWEVLV